MVPILGIHKSSSLMSYGAVNLPPESLDVELYIAMAIVTNADLQGSALGGYVTA
jgi:hypothetical protein